MGFANHSNIELKQSLVPGIEAKVENSNLQAVIDILRRVPLPEVQTYLAESPLIPAGRAAEPGLLQWLERPLELALRYGLESMAHAFGANPHELLAFLHPHCPHATACFQRLTLLRPDRVWGGERVYICRTVRPLSLRWNGPDEFALMLIEGSLEIDRSSRHIGHGSSTVVVAPASSIFISHPSTFMVQHAGIVDLIDHAVAAGIPVTLPPLPAAPAARSEFPISPDLSRHFLLTDDPTESPKA